METINHECYVSPKVAKLLEKAGFDWGCGKNSIYHSDDGFEDSSEGIYLPTLEVAQRWLREVKNTHIIITYNPTLRADYVYDVFVPCNKFWLGSPISYDTYEEALESAIKKALEIILEKGE